MGVALINTPLVTASVEGIWFWPPTGQKEQKKTLRKVIGTPYLADLLKAIMKKNDGLSNPEIQELLGGSSGWSAIWPVRQLLALGFIQYKTDFFGGPSTYIMTELGKEILTKISGLTK